MEKRFGGCCVQPGTNIERACAGFRELNHDPYVILAKARFVRNEWGQEKMRRIQWYEYKKIEGQSNFDKVLQGDAIFHQWGVDYEEFETGPGNYSTAIIELANGTIKNVPAEMVEFTPIITNNRTAD